MAAVRSGRDDDVLLVDAAQMPTGAFAVDSHQRIVFWNTEAEKLLGYREAEVLGKRCGEVLNACHGSGVDACARRCSAMASLEDMQPAQQFETPATARDGTPCQLSVLAVVARNAAGDQRLVHLIRPQNGDRGDQAPGGAASARESSAPPLAAHRLPLPDGGSESGGRLTKREHEVLHLLARGLTTPEIAATLSISPITARNHVTSVIEKLGVRTRLQAVVTASRMGWL